MMTVEQTGSEVVRPEPRRVVAALAGVSRRYGKVCALDELSFEVREGEAVALLGPNGAGKTTAVAVLLGMRRPDSGTATVFGERALSMAARRLVGVIPQEISFPPTLTVREIIAFVAAHYPRPLSIDETLARFELREVAARQTGGLSGGLRRRLGIALAFVGRPRLIFLDEPTTGLDVESRRTVWAVIRAAHDDGATLLLTTHYLEEAESLASRVLVVNRGRLIADGTPSAIKARVGKKRVVLTTDAPLDRLGAVPASVLDRRYTFLVDDVDGFVAGLVHRNVVFHDLEVGTMSLEDAFISLVEGPS